MHTEHDINLGRALAEVIFGLLIAIALHLGLPEAAVARLRARMAVTAEEWEALYTAWLAARLAPVPCIPVAPVTGLQHAFRRLSCRPTRARIPSPRPATPAPPRAPIPANAPQSAPVTHHSVQKCCEGRAPSHALNVTITL
jgi:hypothetical protein